MTSLRFRLLFILIGLFVVAWFCVVLATYAVTRGRIEDLFDSHLDHDANVLRALVSHGIAEGIDPRTVAHQVTSDFQRYQKELAFQVWRGDRVLLHSVAAPPFKRIETAGFRDLFVGERDWRVFILRAPRYDLTIQVGEPHELRGALAVEITREALYPLVLAIPLLGFALWFGVGRGLAPLDRIAAQVAQRTPARLDTVDLESVPAEVDVLVRELNCLLVMLKDAFERERQFTADAAHEIRTPLAGIKTHAQVALRASDDVSRRQALREVVQGVDRTGRLVDQLLTLARLDRETLQKRFETVELTRLAANVVSELAADAGAKGIVLYCSARHYGTVAGEPVALGILLRNLVDNAIRYTGRGGQVEVDVLTGAGGLDLTVTDNGHGIPAAERTRIFDRFHRGANPGSTGCGLGLSIVRRVAELHGASVRLEDPESGTGLRVRVHFPAVLASGPFRLDLRHA
jgi:two-component system sensor histidine kinase QseC